MYTERTELRAKENLLLENNRQTALKNLSAILQSPEETFLREHQISMLQALHDFLSSGETAGYMSEPTGTGKSAVMVKIAEALGLKTVILSPTQQILNQTAKEAQRFTPNLDITNYYSDEKNLSGTVINTTYQSMTTLSKGRHHNFNPREVQLLLCDEAHIALGDIRHTIQRNFPNAIMLGFTATPEFSALERLIASGHVSEDERWTRMFKNLIHEMTLEEAIERGILSPVNTYLLKTNTRVKDLPITGSQEYKQADLERYFITKNRNALATAMIAGVESIPTDVNLTSVQREAIAEIHQKISGKRTVIFGISIDHVDDLAKQINTLGISAAAVHSRIPREQRTAILEAHNEGRIQVILGVDMLRLGWDSPATEVGIYLRPTHSGVVKVQDLGRILRNSEETGKTEAIAIEVVDEVEKRWQAPILFPNVFDPEYVLRGGTRWERSASSKNYPSKDRQVISISGMSVEMVLEEARLAELFKTRFKQASVLEISNILDNLTDQITKEFPGIQPYQLYKKLVAQLPEKFPMEANQRTIQALASIDSNTVEAGKKAFLLLNLKTILGIIDSYYLNDLEEMHQEEKEEMFSTAISYVLQKLYRIRPNLPIASQVHFLAREAVTDYNSYNKLAPANIAGSPFYSLVISTVDGVLGDNSLPLTPGEIEDLAQSLSEQTGILSRDLREFILFRNSFINLDEIDPDEVKDEDRSVIVDATHEILREETEEVLETLTGRERRVMRSRFGLEDGKSRSLEEVGNEFGVTRARIGQIETKALRKLRHPSRSKRLKDFLDIEEERIITSVSPVYRRFGNILSNPLTRTEIRNTENEKRVKEDQLLFDIKRLGLDPTGINILNSYGIKTIGDFFSVPAKEIFENADPLIANAAWTALNGELADLYLEAAEESNSTNPRLIIHIVESYIHQDPIKSLSNLTDEEKELIDLTDWDIKFLPESHKLRLKGVTRKIFMAAYKDLESYLLPV